MNKPLKSFNETLAEQMQNPEFREGFLQAKTELEEFARIRDLRLAAGLSQEVVAQRMGTSQSAVARLEAGLCKGRWPSMSVLQRYAEALGKRLEIRFV